MAAWEVERAIEAIARRQHGAFTRAQAIGAGLTSGSLSRLVEHGRWIRLAPSVYAVNAMPATWQRAGKVAELSVAGSAVSSVSAAVLHGFPGYRPGAVHLTVPSSASARNRLAVIHRSDAVPVTEVDGIRVVTPEHALVTIAGRSTLRQLEAALDALLLDGRASLACLHQRHAALAPGHPSGRALISALLEDRSAGSVVPSTELERLLDVLLAVPGLPPSQREVGLPWWTDGRRVDALVPAWRLIVEADGRRWHGRLADFERDRRRDNDATAHGYRVLRFTWAHLTSAMPDATRQLLDAGRWRVATA